MLDYSQEMYSRLIHSIALRYPSYSILDYCLARQKNNLPESFFIMRHDVDANVNNALNMAKIDAHQGVRATYYFRLKPFMFRTGIIGQIAELGHEIGYHYEVMSDAGGDFKKARELFEANLKKLRNVAPVKTVCMHGRSFSAFNNLDFWKNCALEEFDLIAEPYLSIDYSEIYYFSDTSLCWDNQKFNIRDFVESKKKLHVASTDELINFIQTPLPKKVAVLTHSNFWVDSYILHAFNRFLFSCMNYLKYIRKKRLGQNI